MPEKEGQTTLEKPSWADQVEAERKDGEIPETKVEVNGNTKVVTEYKKNDEGKLTKIIRTYKIETRHVSKPIAQRKTWRKFGKAVSDVAYGPDPATTQVAEEVFLTLTANKETLEQQEDNAIAKLQGQKIQCRYCKGDHWSTKCPYKDKLAPILQQEQEQKSALENSGAGGATATGAAATAAGQAAGARATVGKYIPPGQRAGEEGRRGEAMPWRRDEHATLRVVNLSEETTESDLQELFRPFGAVQRIFLAKHKMTHQSKGFAFVSYHNREDAARAMEALNGYGYDHLILNVEWSKPTTPS
ncbi:eukaryotic translation initiation factor 3 subunit G-like isoform X2 [Oscarella lobularis]|uniref:eukaryotic translation initiation factor 3 subunit G-like isoform X2 n=1 Tax=Oscarella lobularis TaxID=121494 RepID=UPI0033143425